MIRLAAPVVLLCAAAVAVWLLWPQPDGSGSETGPVRPGSGCVPRPPPTWAEVDREQIDAAAKARVPVAFENHLGMRFVFIPAGTFQMGSPADEEGRRADEALHEVTLSRPFYMQVTEVTNAQFRRCDMWHVGLDHDSGDFRGESLDGEDQPAVQVSWNTATEFVLWLCREDGPRRYALPTEAQWEYACRARTQSRFWWGPSPTEGPHCANANDPRTARWLRLEWDRWPQDDGHRLTAPVGSYGPNRWGLYDMTGNVWEWCADWYGPHPGTHGVDPRGPRDGPGRVLRGGSWLFGPAFARSAARLRDGANARSMNVGFRVVSSVPGRSE